MAPLPAVLETLRRVRFQEHRPEPCLVALVPHHPAVFDHEVPRTAVLVPHRVDPLRGCRPFTWESHPLSSSLLTKAHQEMSVTWQPTRPERAPRPLQVLHVRALLPFGD